MLKNILNLENVKRLEKNEQRVISGGNSCNEYCQLNYDLSDCPPPPYGIEIMYHPCCLLLVDENVC
ncbi:hypothetical protein [Aquimarina rhabdastrellae]